MSERSTYVTDLCSKEMAERIATHIAGGVESAVVVEVAPERFVVTGFVRSSWPGGEYELLPSEPLEGAPRLAINCEATKPILWDLATGTWAAGILAT